MIKKTRAPGYAAQCREAIAALAEGDLSRWRGLPEACTSTDVESVLSQVTTPVNESDPYSGALGYARTTAAPYGLTVHYDVGMVDHISIAGPEFPQSIRHMLGEPEAKIPSYLEGSREQWVYPALGLAFHLAAPESGVSWLYVFHPTTRQDYENSPLSRVRTLRHKVMRGTP